MLGQTHTAFIAVVARECDFSATVSTEPFRMHREWVIVGRRMGGCVICLNLMDLDQSVLECDYAAGDDESNYSCQGYGQREL